MSITTKPINLTWNVNLSLEETKNNLIQSNTAEFKISNLPTDTDFQGVIKPLTRNNKGEIVVVPDVKAVWADTFSTNSTETEKTIDVNLTAQAFDVGVEYVFAVKGNNEAVRTVFEISNNVVLSDTGTVIKNFLSSQYSLSNNPIDTTNTIVEEDSILLSGDNKSTDNDKVPTAGYVDEYYVPYTGANKNVDINSKNITNLSNPTNSGDATNKGYVDTNLRGESLPTAPTATEDGYVLTWDNSTSSWVYTNPTNYEDNLGNHTATQALNMDNNHINNLPNPTSAQNPVTKGYFDSNTHDQNTDTGTDAVSFDVNIQGTGVKLKGAAGQLQIRDLNDNNYNPLTASNITANGKLSVDGELDVIDHRIINLDDPVNPTDAVTRQYVDNKEASDISYDNSSSSLTSTNIKTALDEVDSNKLDSSSYTASDVKTKYEINADTNAFTNSEKSKLSGIESNAQENVKSDWNEGDTTKDSYIQNKPTDVTDLDIHNAEELKNVSVSNLASGEYLEYDGSNYVNKDFNTEVRNNTLDQLAIPTSNLNINSNKLTNVSNPTNLQDASTKSYVDNNTHDQNTDTGTTSTSFDIDTGGTGVKIKDESGSLAVRDVNDNSYNPFKANKITAEGGIVSNSEITANVGNVAGLNVNSSNVAVLDFGKVGSTRWRFAGSFTNDETMELQHNNGSGNTYTGILVFNYVAQGIGINSGVNFTEKLLVNGNAKIEGIDLDSNKITSVADPTDPQDAATKNWAQKQAYNYSPSSSSDTSGEQGDIAYDSTNIYVKTGNGWRRASLSSF